MLISNIASIWESIYNFLPIDTIINIWKIMYNYFPLLCKGLGITLSLALVTVIGGAILGLIAYLLVVSKSKVLKFLGNVYIEVIRGVPLLLQLFIIFIIFPNSFPYPKFTSAAVALVINSGAYVAEIIRSGVQAVDKGQTEASMSLGLTRFQTMYKIILPQAIKNILPAIGNEYVTIIKETSLASTVYLGELISVQKVIGAATYLYLDAYIVVGIFYFVSTFSLSKVIRLIEKRMKVSD